MCVIPGLETNENNETLYTIGLKKDDKGNVITLTDKEGNVKTNVNRLIDYGIEETFGNDKNISKIKITHETYHEINKGYKTIVSNTTDEVQNILNNLYKKNNEKAA